MKPVDWSEFLIVIGTVLIMWCIPVKAGQCEDWARIIDVATRLPESEKLPHYARWKALTVDNKAKYRLVLRAIAWVNNGGTSDEAWRLCVSY